MTEQQISQAKLCLQNLDNVAAIALLNLQDRINTQNAVAFLRNLLAEEEASLKASAPPATTTQ